MSSCWDKILLLDTRFLTLRFIRYRLIFPLNIISRNICTIDATSLVRLSRARYACATNTLDVNGCQRMAKKKKERALNVIHAGPVSRPIPRPHGVLEGLALSHPAPSAWGGWDDAPRWPCHAIGHPAAGPVDTREGRISSGDKRVEVDRTRVLRVAGFRLVLLAPTSHGGRDGRHEKRGLGGGRFGGLFWRNIEPPTWRRVFQGIFSGLKKQTHSGDLLTGSLFHFLSGPLSTCRP